MGEKLLTMQEAADLLKVSCRTIYRWKREGRIRVLKISQTLRIPRSEIENRIIIDQDMVKNPCHSSNDGEDKEEHE
ncbi:MAG: helix-turn-helix domain-containing protein [bacterium]